MRSYEMRVAPVSGLSEKKVMQRDEEREREEKT